MDSWSWAGVTCVGLITGEQGRIKVNILRIERWESRNKDQRWEELTVMRHKTEHLDKLAQQRFPHGTTLNIYNTNLSVMLKVSLDSPENVLGDWYRASFAATAASHRLYNTVFQFMLRTLEMYWQWLLLILEYSVICAHENEALLIFNIGVLTARKQTDTNRIRKRIMCSAW